MKKLVRLVVVVVAVAVFQPGEESIESSATSLNDAEFSYVMNY